MKKKHPGGAPSKYKKSFHPKDFIEQSKRGKHVIQIASSWEVHKDSLYEWAKKHKEFSDAFKLGRQHANAYYINLGVAGMTGTASLNGQKIHINYGFYQYITKAMFGWNDNQKPDADEFDLELEVTPYEKI